MKHHKIKRQFRESPVRIYRSTTHVHYRVFCLWSGPASPTEFPIPGAYQSYGRCIRRDYTTFNVDVGLPGLNPASRYQYMSDEQHHIDHDHRAAPACRTQRLPSTSVTFARIVCGKQPASATHFTRTQTRVEFTAYGQR